MTSRSNSQGSKYIKRRMGNDLKQKILVQNGIISEQQIEKKPSVLNCPRCSLVNAVDNKYCSKCSYPLIPSAFDEIKAVEDMKFQALEERSGVGNSSYISSSVILPIALKYLHSIMHESEVQPGLSGVECAFPYSR